MIEDGITIVKSKILTLRGQRVILGRIGVGSATGAAHDDPADVLAPDVAREPATCDFIVVNCDIVFHGLRARPAHVLAPSVLVIRVSSRVGSRDRERQNR